MIDFIHAHSTRLYAVAAAALSLIAYYVQDLPTGLILALVAAILGTGEAVQRVEDRKTAKALHQDPPLATRL
ncbi:hypothetical protein J2Z21_009337 [Streptomyces griseochromogenes]|uniref:Uncharacterized protein n=1 Tax=Streptomyces griseochromogenes TaxID=68214 RepID=A0A1B1B4H3_9ACTN|nr:hypothetical protein [Streptomyces griseochromogenes]ANP53652.1 hypothetical protein AVL59_32575 [Streptomyces griseochromogenes]MBP2056319.1 hypothetical protein [Streptomyces griseochromogenes]